MSTTPSPWAVAAMRSWKNVGQCAGYSYCGEGGRKREAREGAKTRCRVIRPMLPSAARNGGRGTAAPSRGPAPNPKAEAPAHHTHPLHVLLLPLLPPPPLPSPPPPPPPHLQHCHQRLWPLRQGQRRPVPLGPLARTALALRPRLSTAHPPLPPPPLLCGLTTFPPHLQHGDQRLRHLVPQKGRQGGGRAVAVALHPRQQRSADLGEGGGGAKVTQATAREGLLP